MNALFVKTGKNTGPGKIEERIENNGARIVIELYNFNIDGNQLKPEHVQYLEAKVVPYLRKRQHHVKIHGIASQSGNAEYNKALSAERAIRTKNFLQSYGLSEASVPGNEMRAYGEDAPSSSNIEDERERAVRLIIEPGLKSRPLPPDIVMPPLVVTPTDPNEPLYEGPPPIIMPDLYGNSDPIDVDDAKDPISNDFKIKITKSTTLAGMTTMDVIIWDTKNDIGCYYTFSAVTGSTKGPAAETTFEGEWTNFRVGTPHRVTDFSGAGGFGTVGAFAWSKSVMYLPTLQGRQFVEVETGFTVGVPGGGISVGAMEQATRPFDKDGKPVD